MEFKELAAAQQAAKQGNTDASVVWATFMQQVRACCKMT